MNPTSKDMKGIMNKSSYCLLQLLFLACLVCRPNCSSITIYGTIIPQSPTVEIGKEFTATCVLYKAAKATAEDIYWMLKDVTVPKEQYTKINDSAVSVTITITSEMANWLLCKKKETPLNLNQVIHGILLTKGYPPEKPLNLSCMAVQSGRNISSNVTCTWQPGTRDEGLETTYTLFGVSYISASNKSEKADRSSGYIDFVTFPSSQELAMWVEVENKLGKVRSDILDIYAADLVKTNPPSDVNIISENNFSRTLLVSWKHPIHVTNVTLKYNIRFCTVGSGDCTEVPLNDSESYKESFRLQYLKPDTEYVVQVRCMHHRGYWSDWSANTTTRTPEDKPTSKPDLWRVVIPSQVKSERRVQVMYKDPVYSNGRIQGYSIKIQDRNWTTVAVNGSDLDSRSQERKIIPFYQIPWSDTRRGLIELKVWNSVGESPQASLVIPKLTQEPPSVESLSWFTQEGRLWVKWQPPNVIAGDPYKSEVTEYILEWVLVSDGDMDWQRESRHTRAAAIEGNLQKFNRYNISVYPMYSGLTGKPLTIAAFLEQGAPLEGPSVKVRRTGKNDAELEWMKIPLDKQRGFITNYTICFITGGKEHSIVVSPDTYSYTLKRMASNSKYVVRVMASTIKGSTNGSDLSFNTLMYAPGQIEAIVVSVCISFLFFVVLTVLCCINKMDSIKKKIWPPVPNPSNSTIAKWSPDFPSKTDTPKENALSDVSVVEVDMFDTKSMCEEDKAGLLLKKDKYLLEELSSGIGGSSCLSLPHQSFSDSDEGSDSGQTTASTVQYSSVVATCIYKGQTPCPPPQNPKSGSSQTPSFARSESTQPLLDSEEHPEGPESHQRYLRNPYFRRLPGGNDSDSRDLGDLNQLEMEEQGLASRRFCPLEEDFQQTTPTEEDQFRDGQLGSDPSYMPQLSGYRPQC